MSDEDLEDHAAFLAGLDGSIARGLWTWRSFGEYLAVRSCKLRHPHRRPRRPRDHPAARDGRRGEGAHRSARSSTCRRPSSAPSTKEPVDSPPASSTCRPLTPTTEEVAALCEVVAARDLPFFVHVRSESDRVVEATDEVIDVAARTGCHLHYSHIKAAGRHNWHKAAVLIDRIEAARGAGVRVSADVHPYVAGSTTAIVLLPPWVQDGGHEATLRRLHDPSVRARIRRQLIEDTTSWDNWWVVL